jgi:cytochrome P450
VAEETFSLSDGTTIPKGATLGLPTLASTDPAFYPDPLTFDGYRFLNLSKNPAMQQNMDSSAQATSILSSGIGNMLVLGGSLRAMRLKLFLFIF